MGSKALGSPINVFLPIRTSVPATVMFIVEQHSKSQPLLKHSVSEAFCSETE